MKTENWLQFPAMSCSPTGAKHNINGAGGILNRSQDFRARGSGQLYTAKPRGKAETFQEAKHHCASVQFTPFPRVCGETGSLSTLGMRPGLLGTLGGGGLSLGAQCLHLVLSRAQGGVQSECKGEEDLKPEDLGAIDQW